MNIQTVQFPHILETRDLTALHAFLSRTAFVISHKSESIETLLRVLWYIPVNSTIIIVTNCQESAHEQLLDMLKTRLADHWHTYLIHQKDPAIADLFQMAGVPQILGKDGKVHNGKGEGMYIGTLCAHLLRTPGWIIFYDADNFVPSALLEYTFAMCRLFTAASPSLSYPEQDLLFEESSVDRQVGFDLHNVRICWSSKPDMNNLDLETRVLGRTSSVVSPLFETLLAGWFGIQNHPISSSNAGEQGMTLRTATALRFSAGFSVETFLLLDLLLHALYREQPGEVLFQQYLSKSPHFHEKKGERHIKKMIEESLGCFWAFESVLPDTVKNHLQRVYDELQLERINPIVYPALSDLVLEPFQDVVGRYALFARVEEPVIAIHRSAFPTGDLFYPHLVQPDTARQDLLVADTSCQNPLILDVHPLDLLMEDEERAG